MEERGYRKGEGGRRRSGWNSGGHMWLGANWCGVWRRVSPLQPTSEAGSVVSFPSGVRGRALAENGFWGILKATERSFLYLYDKFTNRKSHTGF